jgi:hypothetical protein
MDTDMATFGIILTPHTYNKTRIIKIETVGFLTWFKHSVEVPADDKFFSFIKDMDLFYSHAVPANFVTTKDDLIELADRIK